MEYLGRKRYISSQIIAIIGVQLWSCLCLAQTNFYVAPNGDDSNPGTIQQPFRTIQRGLNVAKAGDRVLVRGGTYNERIRFVNSGNSRSGYIVLRNFRDEQVILDGTGIPGRNIVLIENKHHLRMIGFEIINNLNVRDGSGIRILGHGHHLAIRDNVIHEMRGRNAMAITVYGTSTERPISNISIYNNHIYDCEPAPSEALVINGNVTRFAIANNLVHDVNNIGIDVIGGELDINPDPDLVARNGTIRDNVVFNARSSYGGGFGAGIYVDGGRNIRIDSNEVYECDLGIEVGAENPWATTRNIRVRNNIISYNDKAGLVFGGYAANTGRVERCRFYNNTLFRNDSLQQGYGQIWVQYASTCIVANNIVWGSDSTVLLNAESNSSNIRYDYNNWFYESGPNQSEFIFEGTSYGSFSDYRIGSGQGTHSLFANPRFRNHNAGNFSLKINSPAIDAGSSRQNWYGLVDFYDNARPHGATVDIGAIESLAAASRVEIEISGSTAYNVFQPGKSFSLKVTPRLIQGTAPADLSCQWVDFQGKSISQPIPLAVGRSTRVRSPHNRMDIGYYGLRFTGSGVKFNPQSSQLDEIGFSVLTNLGQRVVDASSPFGLVHMDQSGGDLE